MRHIIKSRTSFRLLLLIGALIIFLLILGGVYYKKVWLGTGGTTIVIRGDAECRSQTNAALEFLSVRAPGYFEMVNDNLGIIECVEMGSAINVYERPPRFRAGRPLRDAGVEWYAGSIVHDACHIKLFNDYQKAHPFISPPREVWSGKLAEEKCINIQIGALRESGAATDTLEYLEEVSGTNYWEYFGGW